jgi:phage terminase large subunit-like protein
VAEPTRGGETIDYILNVAAENRGVVCDIVDINSQEGKGPRAEPVSTMYERGLVHHVGEHRELEDELCDYVPGESKWSPNAMDALVFACSELMPNLPDIPEDFRAMANPSPDLFDAPRTSLWTPDEDDMDVLERGGFFRR